MSGPSLGITGGIKTAIQAGVDSVEHASLIDDEGIRMARDAGTFLVMDVYVSTYILEMGEAAGFLAESLENVRELEAVTFVMKGGTVYKRPSGAAGSDDL